MNQRVNAMGISEATVSLEDDKRLRVEMPDDIMKRDYNDEHRQIDPLVPAEDAHIIDTSDMSINEII